MKMFEAEIVNKTQIVLKKISDLQELYNTVKDEEDFVLAWKTEGVKYSEVMITTNIVFPFSKDRRSFDVC